VPLGISAGEDGLSRINPVGLKRVNSGGFGISGLGEDWSIADGEVGVWEGGGMDIGVKVLSGN
jgi:hypothetical protein